MEQGQATWMPTARSNMSDMRRISLDLDSTLAATQDVAFDLLEGPDHDLYYDDVESWEWGLEKYGADRYLSALWHAWTLRWEQIDPLEPDLAATVDQFRAAGYTVDVVTAHPDHQGISEAKQNWLDEYDIPYDNFVRAKSDGTKADLDYNIYIDDKPSLPEKVDEWDRVYLLNQPYNQDAEGDYKRVETVNEVLNRLVYREHTLRV